jgi:hypothetical protein
MPMSMNIDQGARGSPAPASHGNTQSWTGIPTSQPYGAGSTPLFDGSFLGPPFELQDPASEDELNQLEASVSSDSGLPSASAFEMDQFDLNTTGNASPTYTNVTGPSLMGSSRSSMPSSGASAPSPAPTPSWGAAAKLDSQCVSACCQILMTLERYIEEDVRAVDLMLGTISSSTEAVAQLLELQQEHSSARCFYLFLAIMEQVAGLLERACTGILANRPGAEDHASAGPAARAPRSSIDGLGGPMFALGFSSFEINAADQRAFRAGMILKKVEQAYTMFRRVAEFGKTHRLTSPDATFNRLERVTKRLVRDFRQAEGVDRAGRA